MAKRSFTAITLIAAGALLALWWTGRVRIELGDARGESRSTGAPVAAGSRNDSATFTPPETADTADARERSRHADATAPDLDARAAIPTTPPDAEGVGSSTATRVASSVAQPGSGSSDVWTQAYLAHRTPRISGTVRFSGTPPEMKVIDHWSDSACVMDANARDESVLVHDGALQNVVVHTAAHLSSFRVVSNGQEVKDFDRETSGRLPPVKLTQRGCRFVPHVVVAHPNQRVVFANEDATILDFEVRTHAGVLQRGVVQPHAVPLQLSFDRPAILEVRSPTHPWMNAWIYVTPDNATVTGRDGAFALAKTAAGPVFAWHELYGERDQRLDGDAVDAYVEFTFTPEDAPARPMTASK